MARLKPDVGKLKNIEEVDAALMEIGMLEIDLEKIDNDANKKINEIKVKAIEAGEEKRKRIAEISASIGGYAQYNKGDLFKDKKSLVLAFGEFGFRKSTSISCKKTTVEQLHKLKLGKYIRIKEEPNKEIMAELDDDTLRMVDAVRKIKDDFFCEANRGKINKALLSKESA